MLLAVRRTQRYVRRLQRQRAAGRHGVTRVDRKIEYRVFKLSRIHGREPQIVRKATGHLDTFTERNRLAKEAIRERIWKLYADLKRWRQKPSVRRRRELAASFDAIFTSRTGFATLDRLLARFYANRAAFLRVLDHPDIPLHTNGSENDIRCQVTRRKLSGGTQSDAGRDVRDAMLGLMKTCRKLELSFWDYLGNRQGVPGAPSVADLPTLLRKPAPA